VEVGDDGADEDTLASGQCGGGHLFPLQHLDAGLRPRSPQPPIAFALYIL
jgi:hypothetical protein